MTVGKNLTARGSAARPAVPKDTKTPAVKQPERHGLRIAIVHDWLISGSGGAELVVEQLHKLFPEAPIYTSQATRAWRLRLGGKVKTGVLQLWPLPAFRKFTPVLRAWWFSRLNLRDFDVVISSSGAEAKGIRVPSTTVHINYCHAPTHYYWSRYKEYVDRPGTGPLGALSRFGLRALIKSMRKWDYKAAQRPDFMLANSSHTKAEILKYYDRSASVVYPPVAIERFRAKAGASTKKRRGFVIAGRQTPYKRFDIAVAACTKLSVPLTVIGDGPEHRRLRRLAGKTVTFLGRVSDDVLAEELASAKAFLFPGTDDFGIVAVEALAAGTPVVAYNAGGAKDYVIPGKTGVLFDEQNAASLVRALREFAKSQFDSREIMRFSERFSRQQFHRSMRLCVKRALTEAQREAGGKQ